MFSTVAIQALYVSELGRHARTVFDRIVPDCIGGLRVFTRKTEWVQLSFDWES